MIVRMAIGTNFCFARQLLHQRSHNFSRNALLRFCQIDAGIVFLDAIVIGSVAARAKVAIRSIFCDRVGMKDELNSDLNADGINT